MQAQTESPVLQKHRLRVDEKIGVDMFQRVKKSFDDRNIEFWLDSGTMLGALREGRFIEWDNDIDLCAWKKDSEKIKEAMKTIPYYYYYEEDEIFKRWFYLMYKDRTRLGISLVEFNNGNHYEAYLYPIHFLGRIFDGLMWLLSLYPAKYKDTKLPIKLSDTLMKFFSILPYRNRFLKILKSVYSKLDSYHVVHAVPYDHFMPLRTHKLYGMEVKIPKNAEDYLLRRYGKDWQKPNPNYSYFRDVNNGERICEDGTIIWKSKEKFKELENR